MIENLEQAFRRYGNLTLMDVALEVAFSGDSWRDVCYQAEQLGAATPGYLGRLRSRLDGQQSLNSLVVDALNRVSIREEQ